MPHLLASDGAHIAFDDVGDGRPLLLVHGWATHAGFFAPQRDQLSSRFRVIAPDLRGHGRSAAVRDGLSVDRLATDLVELVARLDLRDVLAVGWSMGAMVVWQALIRGLSGRIAAMAVVDMAPKVVNGDGWTLGLRGSSPARSLGPAAAAMRTDWPNVSRRIAHRIFAPGVETANSALAAWAVAEIGRGDADAMAALWLSLAGLDFRADLRDLPFPTLIAHGLRSRLYAPETAAYLEGLLPDARRVGFEMSGHAPQLEEPAQFNTAITQFAAGLPPLPRGHDRAG